jgi:hypothetical protein
MEVLQEQNIKTFSLLGLKAICSHNRDILFSYNYKTRQEITNMMMNILNEKHIIEVPKFIYKNDKFLLVKKKVI